MDRADGSVWHDERLFRLAIESITDYAVIMLDLAGTIVTWNPGVAKIFGYSEEEFIGQTSHIIFTREDVEKGIPEQEIARTLKDGKANDERWHRRRNGSLLWANGVMMMLREGDRPIGFVKVIRDETHRKELEAQLAEANRMKDEFLGTLSHELRTPLTAILGWTRMLQTGDLAKETVDSALETIERNALAQSRLIEDVLDISRIISGKIHLVRIPFDLRDIVAGVLESTRPAIDTKHLHLEQSLGDSPLLIQGDTDRLRQVMTNLLSNAIKFTPADGTITVRASRLAGRAIIAVQDTGIGMDASFLAHAFDRFSQADSSITRKHGGLGLGLSIVRQLVELHGGEVRAESEGIGNGSTFIVSLPLTDGEPPQGAESATDSPVAEPAADLLHNVNILVVDDETDARQVIVALLRHYGGIVQDVPSVDEALALLQDGTTDIIISDIGMPDRNGLDLVRELHRTDPHHRSYIPAIALSAYAEADMRMQALLAGFQIYLTKPVEPAELVAAVASLAGRTTP